MCRNALPDGNIPMETICQETSRWVNIDGAIPDDIVSTDFATEDDFHEALKKSLKEADEGKLIPLRKVRRETTATRLWQIFVRRVKNG